ncbi:MAG: FAD:protein FMN transferase, partial [Planctomycetales bacterium]|nr:FAD:protein FMN transferase [Planctomycetales bacterium]
WSVGIQHPRQPDGFLSLARLTGRCLATSGDYATTFSADRRHHHIFDPRTGQSPTELASVSVLAPTAMAADALSTAAMVLGVDGTLRLVANLPEVDTLLVDKQGRRHRTASFPAATA